MLATSSYEKGEEFADDAAALLEAASVAQELSKLRVHSYEWSVVVKNADGLAVCSIRNRLLAY